MVNDDEPLEGMFNPDDAGEGSGFVNPDCYKQSFKDHLDDPNFKPTDFPSLSIKHTLSPKAAWKDHWWKKDTYKVLVKNHNIHNSKRILTEPEYYKGLFTVMN